MAADRTQASFVQLAADIVSAYVSNNTIPATDVSRVLREVHLALTRLGETEPVAVTPPDQLRPAVPAKKSVTSDFIICLEDGKKFKSLKRHLRTQYNMSPDEYRDKWGLGPDYPMVAPNYALARSQLAKQMGLGQQRRRRP
ncbi:MAG: transcriptional regulator, MucR family [Hyphomicrobiales bacterium]|nr:transcriptional regulator, MucR family [Hyphomicrobiales bacterium]